MNPSLTRFAKLLSIGVWACLFGRTVQLARQLDAPYPADAVALLGAAAAATLWSAYLLLFSDPGYLWRRAAFGFLFFLPGPVVFAFFPREEIPTYVLVNLYAFAAVVSLLGVVAIWAGAQAACKAWRRRRLRAA